MSELKVYVKPIKTNMFGKMIVGQSYYLKSEADKVIAHQKYKRCLAIARFCEERYNYLNCLENWQMTDKEYQQAIGDFWDRWHNRWQELAEEPTWARFLQLIREEAK